MLITGRRRSRARPPRQRKDIDHRQCEDHATSLSRVPVEQEGEWCCGTDLPSFFNAAAVGGSCSPHAAETGLDHSPVEVGVTLDLPPHTPLVDDESWSDQEMGCGDPSPKTDRGGGSHGNLVPYTDSEVEEGELISGEET